MKDRWPFVDANEVFVWIIARKGCSSNFDCAIKKGAGCHKTHDYPIRCGRSSMLFGKNKGSLDVSDGSG